MHDMKISDKDKKDLLVPDEVASYPYGLKLRLGHEELEKIGMTGAPEVASKYHLMAMVEVVEVSIDQEKGDSKDFSVCLQIKEMALSKPKEEDKPAEAVIYGE